MKSLSWKNNFISFFLRWVWNWFTRDSLNVSKNPVCQWIEVLRVLMELIMKIIKHCHYIPCKAIFIMESFPLLLAPVGDCTIGCNLMILSPIFLRHGLDPSINEFFVIFKLIPQVIVQSNFIFRNIQRMSICSWLI